MARHRLAVLDATCGLIETYRELVYCAERFGCGWFRLVVPLDVAQAASLEKQKRILIVRDSGTAVAARLWGIITGIEKLYDGAAGPAMGGGGVGQAMVEVEGVTFLEYFLGGRVVAPEAQAWLLPDGNGDYTAWSGSYTDVDEAPASHDGDATYTGTGTACDRESYTLADCAASDAEIASITLSSIWRNESAEVCNPAYMFLKIPGYNSVNRVPTGDGAAVSWTRNTGSNDWECVDDAVGAPDDDTTYLYASSTPCYSHFTFSSLVLGSPRMIARIKVTMRARRTGTGAAGVKTVLRVGSTNYPSATTHDLTTSYVDYTDTWLLNPAGTPGPWAWGDLANLQFGISLVTVSGGDTARVTQVYMTVDYVFEYGVGDVVGTAYAQFTQVLDKNPATEVAWTKADLDGLEVGIYVKSGLYGNVRVTSVAVGVNRGRVVVTDHVDDVMKKWVKYALVSSYASADRAVTGFAVEADEHAGASAAYEICFNTLLERLMALAKTYGVGMDVVGDWGGGATKLNAAASYTFNTCVPEGIDRTYDQAVNAWVIISRDRGLVRTLSYREDISGERNVVICVGDTVDGNRLQQTVSGLSSTGKLRREGVLDVANADTLDELTEAGTKFVNDEGLRVQTVRFAYSAAGCYTPLADFYPGDQVTFWDRLLSLGPLDLTVESILCRIGGDGVERYEIVVGNAVKGSAVVEDAAYRAVAKRRTLYTL